MHERGLRRGRRQHRVQGAVSKRGDLRDRLGPAVTVTLHSPRFSFRRTVQAQGTTEGRFTFGRGGIAGSPAHAVERAGVRERGEHPAGWMEAHRLCKDVDEKDTPYVALTLYLDGRLWTDDDELRLALRAKGFDRFYEP